MEKDSIFGKFQGGNNFGFFIPEDRDYYGGDFYVNKDNFNGAVDGDNVEARELKYTKGKKPEVKILKVLDGNNNIKNNNKQEFVEGIYSGGDGNFGFIDVEGMEKGYFVYGKNKALAKDGDKVKAEIVEFKGKKEAIVVKIFDTEKQLVIGKFKDNDRFGFVISDDGTQDIFIAGSRKNGAKNGDKVEVEIIKKVGKNPEGVIVKILN